MRTLSNFANDTFMLVGAAIGFSLFLPQEKSAADAVKIRRYFLIAMDIWVKENDNLPTTVGF